MPELDTTLHVSMLRSHQRATRLRRIVRAVKRELTTSELYGTQWGDPEHDIPLRFIKQRYVLPYCDPAHTALEIGPGGGRWTRYLLGFSRLYVVDYYQELLDELRKNFRGPNMVFVNNNGTDFPGVPDQSVDFLFTFGTFVHLERHLIEDYLDNMRRVVKPGANLVLHYSDHTKVMAQLNDGFSDNDPETMRQMVTGAGFQILEEDLTTLPHSSVVRCTL